MRCIGILPGISRMDLLILRKSSRSRNGHIVESLSSCNPQDKQYKLTRCLWSMSLISTVAPGLSLGRDNNTLLDTAKHILVLQLRFWISHRYALTQEQDTAFPVEYDPAAHTLTLLVVPL
jgi:hypothetical protein